MFSALILFLSSFSRSLLKPDRLEIRALAFEVASRRSQSRICYHTDPVFLVTKIDSIVFGTKIDALATPAGTSTFPCDVLDL